MTPPPTSRLLDAAKFLKEHAPSVAEWPLDILLPWLHWHERNRGLGVAGLDGHLRAVGVARCVRSVEEARSHPYAHHEDPTVGVVLWVEHVACTHPAGLGVLMLQARARFGPRPLIAGDAYSRPGELRTFPWSTACRLILPTRHRNT